MKTYGQCSFPWAAPTLWNSLPAEIHFIEKLSLLKSQTRLIYSNYHTSVCVFLFTCLFYLYLILVNDCDIVKCL